MTLFNKNKYRKVIAIFLLLLVLENLVQPSLSFALTAGPVQPEYTSYEQPGAKDLVNLMTGDFTFSLPILEVPGPEGNFSVPLTYNAGIGLEQEASWVGLGWTMNVGSITRTIAGFPDDANGESQTITVQDLVGIKGWSANTLLFGNFGWDNRVGHYGSLSILGIINSEWDEHHSYVGILGANFSNDGFEFDHAQFGFGTASLVTLWASAAAEVVKAEAAAAVKDGATAMSVETAGKQAAKGALTENLLTTAAFSIASSLQTANSSMDGYFKYSEDVHDYLVYKDYRYWLDQTRVENMYGMLFLGNAPTQNFSDPNPNYASLNLKINNGTASGFKSFYRSTTSNNLGAASDINYMPSGIQPFYSVNNPALLAPDLFSVKAASISGSIEPYRLEIGSVAMPREMSVNHDRLAPIPYQPNDGSANSYKVPFTYRGQTSNRYYHHLGGAYPSSSNSVNKPSNFNFGVSLSWSPSLLTYNLNDVIFDPAQRVSSDVPSSMKIPQSNYIEWLSNTEIKNSTTYASRFMDFLSNDPVSGGQSDRFQFRNTQNNVPGAMLTMTTFDCTSIPIPGNLTSYITNNAKVNLSVVFYNSTKDMNDGMPLTSVDVSQGVVTVNSGNNTFGVGSSALCQNNGKVASISISFPNSAQTLGAGSPNGIGGFCITDVGGATYHFALPVYDYNFYSEIRDTSAPTQKRSIIRRTAPFANNWLLTAITGSDFIDRNQNGIVDDADWGYWVKFNYGIYSSQYTYRYPYSGYRPEYTPTSPNFESCAQGNNQLVYLNTIETRSHVALFLKGARTDAKSYVDTNNPNVVFPLRVEEIALLSKEDYNTLMNNYSTYGVPQFSNKILNTCLSSQFSSSSGVQRDFLNRNCTKRILFNYDYTLCNGVSNSTTGGKLTLKSVSVYGKNNLRLMPDYKFEYNNNPGYDVNLWDGWGYYNSGNTSTHSTSPSNADANGAAWSLTRIINPTGGELNINYERDSYSSISDNQLIPTASFNVSVPPNSSSISTSVLPIDNSAGKFAAGDIVTINSQTDYYCGSDPSNDYKDHAVQNNLTIVSASPTSITLNGAVSSSPTCIGGQPVTITFFIGTVFRNASESKKGEGVRVASLVSKNEFGQQRKTRYIYDVVDPANTLGARKVSTGAIYQEPLWIGVPSDVPGYPNGPVTYGQVTVLSGNLSNDNDYVAKQVYQFETASSSHYKVTQNDIYNVALNGPYKLNDYNYISSFENKIEDRSSRLGKLKSVAVYDATSNQTALSEFSYTEQPINDSQNNYQGTYSSGILMFDRLTVVPPSPLNTFKFNKVNRTTVLRFPYVLSKTKSTSDGFVVESSNLSFDLITGEPNQKLQKSKLGNYIKTVVKPAYTFQEYSELGPRAYNVNNRNILTAIASGYTYKSDFVGSQISLISGSAQSWRKDWSNYRYFDGSAYGESQETISVNNPVWRKGPAFVWKGSQARLIKDKVNDGTFTFSSSDEFNFSGSNPLWQYTGEVTRFDHFGSLLEAKDLNGLYSATKMGYDNRIPVAHATNASYNEIAFSSAEDEIAAIGYFGGEVAKVNGTVVRKSQGADAHTGDCALSLSTGYGFVFKPTNTSTARIYRLSAWSNSTNGRLYYKSNGVDIVSPAPTQQGKTGWYLMNLEIPAGTPFSEVGVKSASGTVLFDDFRFQPKDAAMTCNVYYPLGYQFAPGVPYSSFVIGNDNLYTRYESSEDGKSSRVYAESIKYGGEKLVSEKKWDMRRFYIGN